MIQPAERLSLVSEYYFSRKLKEVAQLNAEGKDIISLAIGSPDMPPSPQTIDRLCEVARQDNTHGYQPTIDVFVLDRAPQTKIHQTLKTLLIRSLQGMMKPQPHYAQYSWKNKILSFVLYLLGRLLPADFKFWLYQKISMSYGGSQSPYSSCYNEPFHDVGILHKAHVLDSLERHPFEDTELTIMRGYHDYLTDMFGDYMTPPAPDERKTCHTHI